MERHNPFRRAQAYRLVYKVEGFELHERTDADVADAEPVGPASFPF